eukprot:4556774-Pyramimonas_sp.AAC.1
MPGNEYILVALIQKSGDILVIARVFQLGPGLLGTRIVRQIGDAQELPGCVIARLAARPRGNFVAAPTVQYESEHP